MDKISLAKELFSQGFNCAQTVFSVFSEDYGLPKEIALKIGCGFGGGIRSGEVCGAVSGAVMVIGLRHGYVNYEDTECKALCYAETSKFISEFKKKNGTIVCRDLLGYDISTPDGMKNAADKGLFKTTCVDMICDAVEILQLCLTANNQ